MGKDPATPNGELEEDDIEQQTASPLPSREVMSIIDVPGPRIPYQPPDGVFATEPAPQGTTEVEDGRLEE